MVFEETFGPWGQIILVTAGAGGIVFLFLLIACFVTPGCLGYECIRTRKKEEKTSSQQFKADSSESVKLGDVSYRSWRLGSLYDNGTICENSESHKGSFNSTNLNPPLGVTDTSSTLNLIQEKKSRKQEKKKPKEFPTELTLSLQYLPPCDANSAKLVIGIEALSNLPPKPYNSAIEPYAALNVVKYSWTNRKTKKLHSFRTRSIRHTAHPIYRETFVIANVKVEEAKEWTLEVLALDHDRYANHTELSNARIPFKEVKKIFHSPEVHLFNFHMKPSNNEFGNILLGVSYLPTAQRLTITITKLRDIPFAQYVSSVNDFNTYVRILMLNGKTGRKMKKKRTKYAQRMAQPEFHETLTFDLAANQLDTVQFLIVVCNKIIIDTSNSMQEHGSDSEDSIRSFKRTEEICIGKVALGKGVRGPTERLHWFSVLQNPRKIITVWHTLK